MLPRWSGRTSTSAFPASCLTRKSHWGSGVDLNRNYGYKWGVDSKGSSKDPCDDVYRGSAPFSEAETRAIRDLVLKSRKISSAVNLHAFGNLWINPFSYSNDNSMKLHFDDNLFRFYSSYQQDLKLRGFQHVGTAKQTIRYLANGDASDWMLGEQGIVSISPELGALTGFSDDFYLAKDDLLRVASDSAVALDTWFEYSMPFFEEIRVLVKRNDTPRAELLGNSTLSEHSFNVSLHFKHSGIVDLRSLILLISFDNQEDAAKLTRVDFNRNLGSSKLNFAVDESLKRVRAKTKVQIPKLSNNRIALQFSGPIEGSVAFQFFKLNKEVATIYLSEDQVRRIFGISWVQTREFKYILLLGFVLVVVFASIKIYECVGRGQPETIYSKPPEVIHI